MNRFLVVAALGLATTSLLACGGTGVVPTTAPEPPTAPLDSGPPLTGGTALPTVAAPGPSGGPSAAGAGDDIVVNRDMMRGMPCHAMGNVIMGDCTDADIARIKQEILARRSAQPELPTADQATAVPAVIVTVPAPASGP